MNDRNPSSGTPSSFNDFSSTVDDPLSSEVSDPLAEVGANQNQSKQATGKAQEKGKEAVDSVRQKTSEVADKAQEKVSEVSGKAQEKADQGIDKASSGLGQAADMLRQQGEQRGGTVASAATMTAEKLDGAGQYLKDKDTDQLLTDLESLIRRKPVESLLVAAGAGFLLSKIFG